MIKWFQEAEEKVWECVNSKFSDTAFDEIFVITGQILTSECFISHPSDKSPCKIVVKDYIHAPHPTRTAGTGDKPWFGHHLISPITPLQGFEHYERFDESTNYSIFLEVTFLPRRVPNTGIRIVYPPVVRLPIRMSISYLCMVWAVQREGRGRTQKLNGFGRRIFRHLLNLPPHEFPRLSTMPIGRDSDHAIFCQYRISRPNSWRIYFNITVIMGMYFTSVMAPSKCSGRQFL